MKDCSKHFKQMFFLFFIFLFNSDFDMYADDSTLHTAAKTLDELELILNNDVECVSKWCKQNRMVANTDKTKCMLITTFQKASRLPRTDLNIVLHSEKRPARPMLFYSTNYWQQF